jgi:quinol monooxygenase YgiN
MEQWTSSNALEAHLKSDHFRSVLGAIEVLGELENLQLIEFKASPENLK